MNAFTCRRTIMKPFTGPMSVPISSATDRGIASHMDQCCCDWRIATATAALAQLFLAVEHPGGPGLGAAHRPVRPGAARG